MNSELHLKNYYTFEDISKAYLCCLKHKATSYHARVFMCNSTANLIQLRDDINSGNYQISKSICFAITNPKPREIWAASFRDRIVHHLVINDIFDYFRARIINTNCSCVPKRGTLYGVNKAIEFVRRASQNYSKKYYVLQCDIKNFFVSIDKNILEKLLVKHIDPNTLTFKLLRQIIYNDLPNNAEYIEKDLHRVPTYKSLRHSDNTHGLPVGDLTSQILSGYVYLNELDQFVKHKLKERYYVRYVDDFIIVGNDLERLKNDMIEINEFLKANLKLELNLNKTNIHDNHFTFLGRRILPYRSYIKNSIRGKIKPDMPKESLNSYYGLLKHANEYNFWKRLNS